MEISTVWTRKSYIKKMKRLALENDTTLLKIHDQILQKALGDDDTEHD